jgi:hypothetical protein
VSASPPPGGGVGDEDEDVQMATAASADEGLKIKPPTRKRKTKKVIPVGRNGLKKRRVEKSRTSFDEKGYMGFLFYFYLVGWLVLRAASMFEFDILLLALCVARIRSAINTKKQNENFQIRRETNLEDTENGRIPS